MAVPIWLVKIPIKLSYNSKVETKGIEIPMESRRVDAASSFYVEIVVNIF